MLCDPEDVAGVASLLAPDAGLIAHWRIGSHAITRSPRYATVFDVRRSRRRAKPASLQQKASNFTWPQSPRQGAARIALRQSHRRGHHDIRSRSAIDLSVGIPAPARHCARNVWSDDRATVITARGKIERISDSCRRVQRLTSYLTGSIVSPAVEAVDFQCARVIRASCNL